MWIALLYLCCINQTKNKRMNNQKNAITRIATTIKNKVVSTGQIAQMDFARSGAIEICFSITDGGIKVESIAGFETATN